MCETGQKLSDLFSSLSRGRRRFDVTAEDLDNLLPNWWSERAFRTTTRCVVSREQLVTIRFTNRRKLQYDHSKCPRCQWSGVGEKPSLCQGRKTWPVDLSYLFVTFSRERTHQEQKKDGKLANIVTFMMYFSFITLFGIHCCNRTAICSSFFFTTIPWFMLSLIVSFTNHSL